MVASNINTCAHCRVEIKADQRWVRKKVYEPVFAEREPQYAATMPNSATDMN